MKTLCIFGDSIVHGSDDSEGGGWAERLKREYIANGEVNTYVLGISGNVIADVIERFPVESNARKPDIIIFAVGINDTAYYPDGRVFLEVSLFERHVETLLHEAKKVCKDILWVGLSEVYESRTQPLAESKTKKCYSNNRISAYDAIIKKICYEMDVLYIPCPPGDTSKYLDGLHPQSDHHARIADAVHTILTPLLSKNV